MRALVVLVIACRPPAEAVDTSPSSQDAETASVEDTARVDDTGIPPTDPYWWFLENTPLKVLLEGDRDPTVGWEVLRCESADGDTWSVDACLPIAHDLSSLGLYTDDRALALFGVVDPSGVDVILEPMALYALVTPDLETWNVRGWYFDALPLGHDAVVDPQIELGDEGRGSPWFYAFPYGWSDPAIIPGDHEMCEGVFAGEAGVRETGCPFALPGLADPSPVRQDGRLLLAATQTDPFRATVWDITTEDEVQLASFEGSVPFLTPWDDHLRLWFQTNAGGLHPSYAESLDGGATWTEPVQPFGEGFDCTANVAGRFRDRWVLFCARRQEGAAALGAASAAPSTG